MTEGALATMGAGSPFARSAGSLGTFIGRRQADRLAAAGRPVARQAIDYADMLGQMRMSPEDIGAAVHEVLADDPSLGTIWKPHPDLDWRVELSDAGWSGGLTARLRSVTEFQELGHDPNADDRRRRRSKPTPWCWPPRVLMTLLARLQLQSRL